MVFERPILLALIPVVLLVLWLGQRGSLVRWSLTQRRVCFLVRGFIVALLGIAIAGPMRLGRSTEAAVVFLNDTSASVGQPGRDTVAAFLRDAATGREKDSAEIAFARSPAVSRPFGEKTPIAPAADISADATDIASALEFSAALLPAGRPGRIVLLSDGFSNGSRDPLSAIPDIVARHIQVDVVPLSKDTRPDAALARIAVPPTVRAGETFQLSATIQSSSALPGAEIRLYQNKLLVAQARRDLTAGETVVVFPRLRAEGGIALYECEVLAPADSRSENNRRQLAVAHGGAARTLIIDRQPAQSDPLRQALEKSGFQVEVRPPVGLPAALDELDNFDLIIFADAPAQDFQSEQLQSLSSWVRELGGGFAMIGGENSFGAGGYFRTPIAALLPVSIEREEREESPVVALLVILDRSGSMSATSGDKVKMTLANEGAIFALDILQARDLFGVFAVDTRVQEVLPLSRVSDRAAAARKIAGITSGGGGIYVYTSLAEALPLLRGADAKIKHIILFADASDAEEKNAGGETGSGRSALDLASALLASRITLSVVALGLEEDKDTAFLRDLASRGGGRFYLTSDAATLPRLFAQETVRATQSSLREDVFLVLTTTTADVTSGIDWNQSPPLLGLNLSAAKPGAELLLSSEHGDPLFVTWRIGLGRVAAFLSDARGRWASEWLGWDGFGKFWTQVARSLVRPDRRNDLSLTSREENGKLVLEAEAVSPDGLFRNGLPVTFTVAEQGGGSRSLPATQVAPGLYRAITDVPVADIALIAASDGTGRPVSSAWTRPVSPEYFASTDDSSLLSHIAVATGGMVNPTPREVFRPGDAMPTRRDLSPWFLAAALILWPFDIWLRRRQWKNPLPPFSPVR